MDLRLGFSVVVSTLLLLLVSLSCPILGENPTFKECRPHIEATIRDLASQVVDHHPVSPSSDQPCPSNLPYDENVPHEHEAITSKEEPQPSLIPEPEVIEIPAIDEPQPSLIIPEPEVIEITTTEEPQPSIAIPESFPIEYESSPDPVAPAQVPENTFQKPVIPEESLPSTAQQARGSPETDIGIFNTFIYSVFGLTKTERDPKFSTPWKTHAEFQKKPKDVSKSSTKVDNTPGIIRRSINKLIGIIFGLSEVQQRDPKWAQPWKTHEEHIKKSQAAAKVKASVPKKSFISFSFFNSFIELIFGKLPSQRDPKFSQPWKTHPEFQKSAAAKKAEAKAATVIDQKPGAISTFFNSIIASIFGLSSGTVRDPKWAQPWKTHDEFKDKISAASDKSKVKKVPDSSPGFIAKFLNRLVLLVFQENKGGRDPKWAKPWKTHEEHQKTRKQVVAPIEKVKASEGIFGLTFMNNFIEIIFGKTSGKRDPKWADSWKSHPEFIKSSKSASVAAPTVASIPKPQETQLPKRVVETPIPESSPAPATAPTPAPTPIDVPAQKKMIEEKVQEEEKLSEPSTEEKQIFPSDTEDQKNHERATESHSDRVVDDAKASVKQVLEEVEEVEPEKPEVQEEPEEPEIKPEIIPRTAKIIQMPSSIRSRDHIESILGLDDASMNEAARTNPISDSTLRELKKIYETSVKPLEVTYKYKDISNRHLSDAELFGTPLVLLLGPYSTGKSSFINYLLGIEFTKRALKTGTPPSHGVFRIVQYGDYDRDLDGTDISGHWSFGSLQKFGQNFVDQIKGKSLNHPLLKKATFVEAPGILEMRRPSERLYPFNDVIQWFIDRADLILVMFDYTKLDAGYELEAVLDQLKGRESQTRILLNKADQVPPDELIKVQGTLFWNLSPLLAVNIPPVVYAGSFASHPYNMESPVKLFEAQEEALLYDIAKAINSRVDNRIAIARRHAVRVRNHAQMVDTYLTTFYKNKGFLTSNHKLVEEIIENPHAYNIYEGMSLLTNISRYDLPDAEVYRDFFRIHNLYEFPGLRHSCSYIGGCPLDKIDATISKLLPQLLMKHKKLVDAASSSTRLPNPTMRSTGIGAGAAQVQTNKL